MILRNYPKKTVLRRYRLSKPVAVTVTAEVQESLEYKVKKEGWGGGGTRQVQFTSSSAITTDIPHLKSSGKVLSVIVAPGLPNTTKPVLRHHNLISNQQRSKWKKIDNGQLTLQPMRSAPKVPLSSPPSGSARRVIRAPPPPSEPAPPNQPIVRPTFRLPQPGAQNSARINPSAATSNSNTQARFMQTPEAGLAGAKRVSLNESNTPKPVPGGGKPRPPMKPKPALSKCKALYDYTAQDLDELSFKEGDIIEILKEHDGGWWQGKLRGKEGLLPANYIEKL